MTDITVIILTRDEACHIERAIASVKPFARRILIVDSGSDDQTVTLAKRAGAEVLYHAWVNYAAQFNWAIEQVRGQTDWIMRLDADEVVMPDLARMIASGLPDVDGIYVTRRIKFMGQLVRHGGISRLQMLRLFRAGTACCEQRWMDEHIVVNGPTTCVRGAIVDDSLKPLDWWVAKHNAYANREVVDILAQRYDLIADHGRSQERSIKRWVKAHIYQSLPLGLRAGGYFFYRYILRLGFLDGRQARAFHVLQGFWYRYLVDMKLAETERLIAQTGMTPPDAIAQVLGVQVPHNGLIAA